MTDAGNAEDGWVIAYLICGPQKNGVTLSSKVAASAQECGAIVKPLYHGRSVESIQPTFWDALLARYAGRIMDEPANHSSLIKEFDERRGWKARC